MCYFLTFGLCTLRIRVAARLILKVNIKRNAFVEWFQGSIWCVLLMCNAADMSSMYNHTKFSSFKTFNTLWQFVISINCDGIKIRLFQWMIEEVTINYKFQINQYSSSSSSSSLIAELQHKSHCLIRNAKFAKHCLCLFSSSFLFFFFRFYQKKKKCVI